MDYCFCSITAFEILKRMDVIPSVAFERDSSAALQHCSMSNSGRSLTLLDTFHIESENLVHMLVGTRGRSSNVKGVERHVIAGNIPANAVFALDTDVYCTSPEETYLSLASSFTRQTTKDLGFKYEVTLAMYGMELCGLYFYDGAAATLSERKIPLTSKKKIAAYLDGCGGRFGVKLARKALEHVEDRLRSPMEIACALLLCRPQRIGSMGFPLGEANCTVETSEGVREVDRLWKKSGLGYEYQGREYHTTETRRQEDRRRNALLGSGITIMNIWYEDLVEPHAFRELSKTLAKTMGRRLRSRASDFAWKQQVLRSVVLPSLNRYG